MARNHSEQDRSPRYHWSNHRNRIKDLPTTKSTLRNTDIESDSMPQFKTTTSCPVSLYTFSFSHSDQTLSHKTRITTFYPGWVLFHLLRQSHFRSYGEFSLVQRLMWQQLPQILLRRVEDVCSKPAALYLLVRLLPYHLPRPAINSLPSNRQTSKKSWTPSTQDQDRSISSDTQNSNWLGRNSVVSILN